MTESKKPHSVKTELLLLLLGVKLLKQVYKHVFCSVFPPIRCSFAYGSAVFNQHQRSKGKMLDVIFVVDSAAEWHRENIRRNKHHYSFLHHIGEDNVALIQRAGAGVYFNPYVRVDSQIIKYGVMEMDDFLDDLRTWKWLYVSGRLHKPVVFLTDTKKELVIAEALKYNLYSAACCATLLMEKDIPFTSLQYFSEVVGLSYTGDFRMYVGEDKMKVHNIAKGSMNELNDLYLPVLSHFIDFLPGNMMVKKQGITISSCMQYIPETIKCSISSGKTLREGLVKSLSYSLEKLQKMLFSMTK